ncbi:MAG TPA: hypothetical protein VG713_16735 [Pirellulales bacterium]|nr:hypothetical protein [Pirellulales bacterium]
MLDTNSRTGRMLSLATELTHRGKRVVEKFFDNLVVIPSQLLGRVFVNELAEFTPAAREQSSIFSQHKIVQKTVSNSFVWQKVSLGKIVLRDG